MKLNITTALFCLSICLVNSANASLLATVDIKPTFSNIEYAKAQPTDSKGHLLDLYLPQNTGKPAPLIISTSGSAWLADTGKVGAPEFAQKLLPKGYAVAGVSVRSSSQVQFPGQLHDIKAAIRWLKINASKYNIDPNRIGIVGDSSGGWTSAMAAVTGDVPDLEGNVGVTGVSSAVQAAIAFYPPVNFTEMDNWAVGKCAPQAKIGGIDQQTLFCHDSDNSPEALMIGCTKIQDCKAKVQQANPVNYISKADPPIMILHGRGDRLVPHNQGERFYQALNKACKEATFISLPLAGHGPISSFLNESKIQSGTTIQSTLASNCAFESPKLYQPSWTTLIEFFDRNLKG